MYILRPGLNTLSVWNHTFRTLPLLPVVVARFESKSEETDKTVEASFTNLSVVSRIGFSVVTTPDDEDLEAGAIYLGPNPAQYILYLYDIADFGDTPGSEFFTDICAWRPDLI